MQTSQKRKGGFGSLLRERRRALGLTLRDMERVCARRGLEVSRPTLSRVESGRQDPRLGFAKALCRAYQLDYSRAMAELASRSVELPKEWQGKDPETLKRLGKEAWIDVAVRTDERETYDGIVQLAGYATYAGVGIEVAFRVQHEDVLSGNSQVGRAELTVGSRIELG